MASISSLVSLLSTDYPQFTFACSDSFHWSPDTTTIMYTDTSNETANLLHELAHALLGHRDFSRDVQLLEMERDAWHLAQQTLAQRYGVPISDDQIEDALDSYRDWLHARSLCPTCGATGIQSSRAQYRCLACLGSWRVNDARHCALRRYKATKKPA